MAKKKQTETVAEQQLPVRFCGHCVDAYGHCVKGADGEPVLCRCRRIPDQLLLCSSPACTVFVDSKKPYPSVFPYGFSENQTPSTMVKVVPLFKGKDKTPWICIPVSQIPVGGIGYDGSPVVQSSI